MNVKNYIIAGIVAFAILFMWAIYASASPIDGTKVADSYVEANGNDIYRENFLGGEGTTITLNGNCEDYQDIDLWVYDENDNLVAKSTSHGCYETTTVYPRWTGTFKIVIENRNKPYDTYYHLEMQ